MIPAHLRLTIAANLGTGPGEGTSNEIPRVTYGDVGNWLFSDLYLQDGDYIRLQNLWAMISRSHLLEGTLRCASISRCRISLL